MLAFFYILVAVTVVSLLSFIGVITLAMDEEVFRRMVLVLVAFAAGTLLAAAFVDLIPEALEELEGSLQFVLVGVIFFFLLERGIHWHHCADGHCEVAPVGYLNLVGDGVHNFVDGVVIAASFLSSIKLGLITTVAIGLHEIPQELGDFAILVHSGFSKRQALFWNFISATSAILGAVLGYLFLAAFVDLIPYILALAAGGFIYIAVADLLPELHKERQLGRVLTHTLSLILGTSLIVGATMFLPHAHF